MSGNCKRSARLVAFAVGCAGMLTALSLSAHEAADTARGVQVQIDKAEQRQLGIRTQRADTPPALQLWPARVIADPERGARVMADQPGVVEATAGGLPLAGSAVRAGQVLAYLRPTYSDPERRDLEADWEAAKRAVALGRMQIQRYSIDEAENLEVRLLTPSVQILLDYRAALAREAQLARALSGQVEIRAPVSGVILSANARAGRVVAAGETLFELNAVNGAAIEAQFSDDRFDVNSVTQAFDRHQHLLKLSVRGSSLDPLTRTRRVVYRIASPVGTADMPELVVGEPLQLRVPVVREAHRYQLPAGAVFRANGRSWVWVHVAPEQFIAEPVQVTSLDADWLQIDAGIAADQRIVTEGGAALLRHSRRTVDGA